MARVAYHVSSWVEQLPVAAATLADKVVSVGIDRHRILAYVLILLFVISGSGLLAAMDAENAQEVVTDIASEWLDQQAEEQPLLLSRLQPLLAKGGIMLLTFIDLAVWAWVGRLSWLAHVALLRGFFRSDSAAAAAAAAVAAAAPAPATAAAAAEAAVTPAAAAAAAAPAAAAPAEAAPPPAEAAASTGATKPAPAAAAAAGATAPATAAPAATAAPPPPTAATPALDAPPAPPATPPPAPSPPPPPPAAAPVPIPHAAWYAALALRFACLMGIDSIGILFRNVNCLYWGVLFGQYRHLMLAAGPAALACSVAPLFVADVVMWLVQDLAESVWVCAANAAAAMLALVAVYEVVLRNRVADLKDYLL